MGIISLQSPKCGMKEDGPALLQDWLQNFSARNAEIRAPSALPPRTRPSGRVHGQAGRIPKKRSERNKTAIRFIFANVGERARGAGNFHFPLKFYSRAQSGRMYAPAFRPVMVRQILPRLLLGIPAGYIPVRPEKLDAFPESPAQLYDAPVRCEGWACVQR